MFPFGQIVWKKRERNRQETADKEVNKIDKVKRTLKDMSHTGLKTNSPKDFLDYSFSYYIPETRDRIEAAAEKFLTEIGVILADDRIEAEKNRTAYGAGSGQHMRFRDQ